MNLDAENKAGWIVLHLKESRLDAHNSGELKERILKFLEQGQNQLIIDLSQVSFIDSSGLGALLSGYKNANLHHGRFILAGPQPRVQAMFELTRLNRVFDVYADVEDALAGA